jgi:hypothetical protein
MLRLLTLIFACAYFLASMPAAAQTAPAAGQPARQPVAGQPGYTQPQAPRLVGYRVESEPRVGLIVGGSVLFGIAYFVPLSIVAAAEFPNESEWLAIPVAGPFITMAKMDWNEMCEDDVECSLGQVANVFGGIGLVVTGLMQAGGVAMITVGAAVPNERVVPEYAIAPVPMGKDGGGVAVTGRF